MANELIPNEEMLEVAAWVCYVHSREGRTDFKVTDTPRWNSNFQREKFLRRAKEVFEVVAAHRKPVEESEMPERLITSSDVNRAGAAKANALWGGSQ
jgi:hypothetical protein